MHGHEGNGAYIKPCWFYARLTPTAVRECLSDRFQGRLHRRVDISARLLLGVAPVLPIGYNLLAWGVHAMPD